MKDIEIASTCIKKNILDVAVELGIDNNSLECYGKYKAKINYDDVMQGKKAKLILVTATSPTPFGEGKTTVSIGLTDAFKHIGKKALAVLREPSLGPVFGLKGGATGGGYSQVVPMEDINLHFTGDMHAITSCNNLIAAAIDNHIYFGNELNIDINNIYFKRCLDINDRFLRNIKTVSNTECTRNDNFNITAASEIMSIFCLSRDLKELRNNLSNIIFAKDAKGEPLYVRDLNLEGSLVVLLRDAFKPNLVQTLENNPVLIHGGPFANVAHGCNSIIATNLALKLTDYVVTEAGFGSDLGAEKFFDIKCRKANLKPNCVILTTTLRALKYNGGVSKKDINLDNIDKLRNGLSNLEAHLTILRNFTSHIIVCLNKFDSDIPDEIDVIRSYCNDHLVQFSICDSYRKGGIGAIALADKVVEMCDRDNDFKFLYNSELKVTDKIEILSRNIYQAKNITYTDQALRKLDFINSIEMSHLPICVAKTQYSISDDPKLLGFPKGHEIIVSDIQLYNGAGFITVLLGKVLTMPALPKNPNYEKIDLDEEDRIIGLF